MALRILSAASSPPLFSLDQTVTADYAVPLSTESEDQERLLKVLYRRTRIKRRGSILLEETDGQTNYDFFRCRNSPEDRGPSTSERMAKYEKHAGKLALRASQEALRKAEVAPAEITHLITVTCTGFYAPGIDYDVTQGLGLRPTVERVQVGFMGCHAVLNAVRIASAIARADEKARVLIASVELCSLHFQYGWDSDQVVSNSLFADGAGALVGCSGNGSPRGTNGWTATRGGSRLLPDSADAMTWRIGDHGFQMTLSAQVPDLIERNLAPHLDEWLAVSKLTRGDIATWAIHPGGPRILNAADSALGLRKGATSHSRWILGEHGNMSSATLIFLLERLMETGAELPCLALGFGPGLTIESALFQ